GRVYMARGDFEQARVWLGRALAGNADHWRALYSCGGANANLKRWRDARCAYRQALAISASAARLHARTGWSAIDPRHQPEAEVAGGGELAEVPLRRRGTQRTDAVVGSMKRRMTRIIAAIVIALVALSASTSVAQRRVAALGDSPAALVERARAAYNQGRYQDALETARRAAEAAPRSLPAQLA